MGDPRVMFEDQTARVFLSLQNVKREVRSSGCFCLPTCDFWRTSHWSLPVGTGLLSAVPREVLRLDGAFVALLHPSAALITAE